jgi:hypothetical protein
MIRSVSVSGGEATGKDLSRACTRASGMNGTSGCLKVSLLIIVVESPLKSLVWNVC